jgi:hypothetical protein
VRAGRVWLFLENVVVAFLVGLFSVILALVFVWVVFGLLYLAVLFVREVWLLGWT